MNDLEKLAVAMVQARIKYHNFIASTTDKRITKKYGCTPEKYRVWNTKKRMTEIELGNEQFFAIQAYNNAMTTAIKKY